MVFRNLGFFEFRESARNKSLICFGAGRLLQKACEEFMSYSLFDMIDFIADNDQEKRVFSFEGKLKIVTSIEECLNLKKKEPIILITVSDCIDIIKQLNKMPELKDCECYIYVFMQYYDYCPSYILPTNRSDVEETKIPKLIHFCWFGGNQLPEEYLTYMKSWAKYCPDYEIIRWDDDNYDFRKNRYMYEAYKNNKWAFVSDYARLDVIHQYGGVYLDTDVELIRNIDDLLCDEAFCGFDQINQVANGLGYGAVAGFHMLSDLMRVYDSIPFDNPQATMDLKTGPHYQTEYFQMKGLLMNNTLQVIEGMKVYPTDVLAPLNNRTRVLSITSNTYAIHHYAASWVDEQQLGSRNLRVGKFADIISAFE